MTQRPTDLSVDSLRGSLGRYRWWIGPLATRSTSRSGISVSDLGQLKPHQEVTGTSGRFGPFPANAGEYP